MDASPDRSLSVERRVSSRRFPPELEFTSSAPEKRWSYDFKRVGFRRQSRSRIRPSSCARFAYGNSR